MEDIEFSYEEYQTKSFTPIAHALKNIKAEIAKIIPTPYSITYGAKTSEQRKETTKDAVYTEVISRDKVIKDLVLLTNTLIEQILGNRSITDAIVQAGADEIEYLKEDIVESKQKFEELEEKSKNDNINANTLLENTKLSLNAIITSKTSEAETAKQLLLSEKNTLSRQLESLNKEFEEYKLQSGEALSNQIESSNVEIGKIRLELQEKLTAALQNQNATSTAALQNLDRSLKEQLENQRASYEEQLREAKVATAAALAQSETLEATLSNSTSKIKALEKMLEEPIIKNEEANATLHPKDLLTLSEIAETGSRNKKNRRGNPLGTSTETSNSGGGFRKKNSKHTVERSQKSKTKRYQQKNNRK